MAAAGAEEVRGQEETVATEDFMAAAEAAGEGELPQGGMEVQEVPESQPSLHIYKMEPYAVIEFGYITNVVQWDGVTHWSKPDGCTVMLLADAEAAGIPHKPIPPPTRRVWQNTGDFWGSFTTQEQLALSASAIPEVKALVVSLLAHHGEFWSDDARVQAGFHALIQSGLISEARANEILHPPGLQS